LALTLRTIKTVFTSDFKQLKQDTESVRDEFKKTRQEMKSAAKEAEKSQSAMNRALSTTASIAKGAGKAFLAVTGGVTALLLSMQGISKVADVYARASLRASLSTMNLGAAATDLAGMRFPKLTYAVFSLGTGLQMLFARFALIGTGIANFADGTFRGDSALRKMGLTTVKAALGLTSLLGVAKQATDTLTAAAVSGAKTSAGDVPEGVDVRG